MIIDDLGRLVWFRAMRGRELVTDFRAQIYGGKPVLTWWQGRLSGGDGRGEGVIYSDQYRPIRRVRMGNGLHADLHEFELTPQGTALLIAYDTVSRPEEGRVVQAVVQEVEIDTGLVRFEWHSIGQIAHLRVVPARGRAAAGNGTTSTSTRSRWTRDGNFIISARQTHAVYKLSRRTGRVLWRLGGRKARTSGSGRARGSRSSTTPARSPTARSRSTTTAPRPPVRKRSRAISLALDERRKVATLRYALTHPKGCSPRPRAAPRRSWAATRSSAGARSGTSASTTPPGGSCSTDSSLRGNDSYRAYRFPWVGRPDALPKLVATRSGLRVSWNGATQVASWQVLAGPGPTRLAPVANVPTAGFETAIPAQPSARYVAVRGSGRRRRRARHLSRRLPSLSWRRSGRGSPRSRSRRRRAAAWPG